MTELERHAAEGMAMLKAGNEDQAYSVFRKMYFDLREDPSALKRVTDHRIVGQGLEMLLTYGMIDDIDTRQMIASVSYLMLSHGLRNGGGINLNKDRVTLVMTDREALRYTVMAALIPDQHSIFGFQTGLDEIRVRRAMRQMELFDLMAGGGAVAKFQKAFMDELNAINYDMTEGFMRDHSDVYRNYIEGEKVHTRLYNYLSKKVFEEEDIDF